MSMMKLYRLKKISPFLSTVLVIGASTALLGAACGKTVGNENIQQNTNVAVNTNSTGEIDTSDWQTYTSEEYGFSFRYPKELKIDVQKEKELFRIYITNTELEFNYDFMALKFDSFSNLTIEEWFEEYVDIKNVLYYKISTTSQGYKILTPMGGRDLDDLGEYQQIFSFVEDNVNLRSVAIFGGQDFYPLESLGYYQPDLIKNIMNSIKFYKINS